MRSHLRNVRHNRSTGPAPFWGTLQNPEAHKNSMSKQEYDAYAQRRLSEREAAARQRDAEELAAQQAAADFLTSQIEPRCRQAP